MHFEKAPLHLCYSLPKIAISLGRDVWFSLPSRGLHSRQRLGSFSVTQGSDAYLDFPTPNFSHRSKLQSQQPFHLQITDGTGSLGRFSHDTTLTCLFHSVTQMMKALYYISCSLFLPSHSNTLYVVLPVSGLLLTLTEHTCQQYVSNV